MKQKRIILIVVAVIMAVALLVIYYFYLGSTVPNGQQALARLDSSNIGSLKNAFNESADSVRMLVMLSPT